jgi:beta-glucanase (GH16 family)
MIKFKKIAGLIIVFVIASCSKSSSTSNVSPAPSNLTVNAVVSTDSSGNVAFTAAAVNAVSYDFDFGNGVFQTVASGVVTYKYPSSGTYSVNVIARNAGGQTISGTISVTVAVRLSLVWSDEFDTPGAPDPSKWGFDIGTGSGGWGNNELEYYTNRSSNAIVQNGMLMITAVKENYLGSAYTSARLLSQNKFSCKYGRIEVRAKIPPGVGTWPAIWMLGSNISTAGWPACGEMDIMEERGSEPNKIYGTFHYPGHSGSNGNGSTTMVPDATTAFHSYILDWSATSIKIYVDTQLYYTLPNNMSLPFNQNFFILLNVAMGGNFGGPVDPAFTSATMQIDYVRVYQ